MIDDDINNIKELSTVTNAICYETPSNISKCEEFNHGNSFFEIYNNISKTNLEIPFLLLYL